MLFIPGLIKVRVLNSLLIFLAALNARLLGLGSGLARKRHYKEIIYRLL
jgi:hypothetical protein